MRYLMHQVYNDFPRNIVTQSYFIDLHIILKDNLQLKLDNT